MPDSVDTVDEKRTVGDEGPIGSEISDLMDDIYGTGRPYLAVVLGEDGGIYTTINTSSSEFIHLIAALVSRVAARLGLASQHLLAEIAVPMILEEAKSDTLTSLTYGKRPAPPESSESVESGESEDE